MRKTVQTALVPESALNQTSLLPSQHREEHLDPLAFVWSRERCTWRHHPETREEYWLKNLRKVERLGCDLDRVLMVDDEAHKLEQTTAITPSIAPFTGTSGDSNLPSKRLIVGWHFVLTVKNRPPTLPAFLRCSDERGLGLE
jgi:NLI interacting factor-like phosphatase